VSHSRTTNLTFKINELFDLAFTGPGKHRAIKETRGEDMRVSIPSPCSSQGQLFSCTYSIPPYKWSPYKGRILLSDILGRRRRVGFVRESYAIRGGTL
jgi:hypothetical protein